MTEERKSPAHGLRFSSTDINHIAVSPIIFSLAVEDDDDGNMVSVFVFHSNILQNSHLFYILPSPHLCNCPLSMHVQYIIVA